MNLLSWLGWLAPAMAAPLLLAAAPAPGESPLPPNIVILYSDDIGFGDFSCYGAKAIRTPNVDRLASGGLRFTNAYASSATCTPSRFAILTGKYPFRQKDTAVLPGNAPLIIEPGSATMPSILQRAGYTTAAIGKWHLGLGPRSGDLDWNGEIKPGPLEVGFDYCYIIPATPDRVPCVYVENHHVVNLDPADPIRVSYDKAFSDEATVESELAALTMKSSDGHSNAVINGIGRIGYMVGGKSAIWKDDEMEQVLAQKAVEFIEKNRRKPFFLYYASHDIHVPRVPNKRFAGKSGMGPRGDQILEFDWAVGHIMHTLERLKLKDNTLVIISSDNGPVLDDGYADKANELLGKHKPAGPFRGGKYSLFEGGTRIPFIVSWPKKVKPGISSALVSQVDLAASFAALVGQQPAPNDFPDSMDELPALLGESQTGRTSLVEDAKRQALRAGDWKFIPPGSTVDQLGPWRHIVITPPGFLFNVTDDPGETTNVASGQPGKLKQMRAELEQVRSETPKR